jgi:hypothetical protein
MGGKLLGAGGGGFILFFVSPDRREAVTAALRHLETIPIQVKAPGTEIIHASATLSAASTERHAESFSSASSLHSKRRWQSRAM